MESNEHIQLEVELGQLRQVSCLLCMSCRMLNPFCVARRRTEHHDACDAQGACQHT